MRLDEATKSDLIRDCVDQWEQEFGNDSIYGECLETVRKVGLGNVANLTPTIKRFLYIWGRMGRVLGRLEYTNWEAKLKEQIEYNFRELEEFRKMDLTTAPLENCETSIRTCYESLTKAVSPVATAKTLHLICPNFFPLWDNPIANAVRKERKSGKCKDFSSGDYYHFMLDVREFAVRYSRTLEDLAHQYERSKLRILDEFLWWITHHTLSIF